MTGRGMRAGVVLPGGTANQQLEQAVAAEQAGWDGVFVWDHLWNRTMESVIQSAAGVSIYAGLVYSQRF